MITASYILGGWEYSTWQIKKIEHSGKWYYGLCEGNGEEWGTYEDLSARLYKVLPPPPKQ